MKYLALDIGGTIIKSAIISMTNNDKVQIIERNNCQFDQNDPLRAIKNCIDHYSEKDYEAVAISATGIINQAGIVIGTNGKINNYLNLDLQTTISKYTRRPVSVINDVNAIAYNELCNEKHQLSLIIALGTGIGGALIYNDQVITGANGSFAEIGQMWVNHQRFEELASTKALVQLANNKYSLNVNNGIELFALKSNQQFHQCIDEWLNNLVLGIGNCVYAYNPQKIIIAGGISSQTKILLPQIKEKITKALATNYTDKLEIIMTEQKNDAGMIGAVMYMRREG